MDDFEATKRISGAIDNRLYDLLAGKVSGNFDPLKGRLDQARTESELDRIGAQNALNNDYLQLQREQLLNQLDQMRHEREVLRIKRDNELAALRASATPPAINTTGTPQAGSPPSAAASLMNDAAVNAANKQIEQLDTLLTNMQGRLNTLLTQAQNAGIFSRGAAQDGKSKIIIDRTGADQLPLDQLHDFEAMRNAIIAVRRKRMLDDAHDRMGSNLHHLHFRLTLTPPAGETRLCKVEAALGRITHDYEDSDGSNEHAKDRYLNALAAHIRRETQAFDERFNELFPKQYHSFANSVVNSIHDMMNPEAESESSSSGSTQREARIKEISKELRGMWQNYRSKQSTPPSFNFQQRMMPLPQQPQPSPLGMAERQLPDLQGQDIAWIAPQLPRWCKSLIQEKHLLKRYAEFVEPLHLDMDDHSHVKIVAFTQKALATGGSDLDDKFNMLNIAAAKRGSAAYMNLNMRRFAGHFPKLRQNSTVIAVEPSEYAQNISSVAAYEKVRTFIMTLTAALGKSGSLAGEMQSMLRSQKVLDSIQRKPLAVGFIHSSQDNPSPSGDTFGWYLGPRFEIQEKKGFPVFGRPKIEVAYTQAETVFDLEYTVVTPALAREVDICYRVTWIDPKTGEEDMKLQPKLIRQKLRLTPDYDAFINGILQHQEGIPNGPLLSISSASEVSAQGGYSVAAGGEPATTPAVTSVNLYGSDLWRNPEVYLDGIRAKGVSIDPDMRGLRAEFEVLPQCYDGFADLTVVTSTGRDSLVDFVRVVKTSDVAANIPPPRERSFKLPAAAGPDFDALVQGGMADFLPPRGRVFIWDYTLAGAGSPFLLETISPNRPKTSQNQLLAVNWSARIEPTSLPADMRGLGVTCAASPGFPYYSITPGSGLKGVEGFNTHAPVLKARVRLLASLAEWPQLIEFKKTTDVVFFQNIESSQLAYKPPVKKPEKPGDSLGTLKMVAGTDANLFFQAWVGYPGTPQNGVTLRKSDGVSLPVTVIYASDATGPGGYFELTAQALPAAQELKPDSAAPKADAKKNTDTKKSIDSAEPQAPGILQNLSEPMELILNAEGIVLPIRMPK